MSDIITPVTKSLLKIRRPYIDSTKDRNYIRYRFDHPGIDIYGKDIYAICSCVCTFTGYNEDDGYVIIVQYDRERSFRYCNLTDIYVRSGQLIEVGTLIGRCKEYVHFEFLSRDESRWPVRIGQQIHYKNDPYLYVSNQYTFINTATVKVNYDISPNLPTLLTRG